MESLTVTKPKLGFAGVGWIGRHRLKAITGEHIADTIAVTDPDASAIQDLKEEVPEFDHYDSFEAMLDSELDGVVIATPSGLHATQAMEALQRGKAVFCQKPLGRNAEETGKVVETAREEDLLLGVDYSYRYTQGMQKVKQVIDSGKLGSIYGVQLTFHNAYGPNKSWYRDPGRAGGGCLMDLGIHLVDLLYWVLDEPEVRDIKAQLFHDGQPLSDRSSEVEDYVAAQLSLDTGASVQLGCSWNLPAGRDAVIEATFYGEEGGVSFRNVEGSFYDFTAEEYQGTSTQVLTTPPDSWGGRAAVAWARQLAEGKQFSPSAATYTKVAQTLDRIYKEA